MWLSHDGEEKIWRWNITHTIESVPYGCLEKRPQAHLAARALQHATVILLRVGGRQPRRVGNEQPVHDLSEAT